MKIFPNFRRWFLSPIIESLRGELYRLSELIEERPRLKTKIEFYMVDERCNAMGIASRFEGSTFTGKESLACTINHGEGTEPQQKVFKLPENGALLEFLLRYDFQVVSENFEKARHIVASISEKRAEVKRAPELKKAKQKLDVALRDVEHELSKERDKKSSSERS